MKAFIVLGLAGFAAARYVFDCSTQKSFVVGLALGALADYLAEQKPVTAFQSSQDYSPVITTVGGKTDQNPQGSTITGS